MDVLNWALILLPSFTAFHFEPRVDSGAWFCDPYTWTKPVQYQNGSYIAEIRFDCELEGTQKGGLGHLYAYWSEKIRTQASVIFEDEEVQYQNLPGVRIDTQSLLSTENRIVARQVHTLATDKVSTLIYDTFSKKIHGQGNAAYLVAADSSSIISATRIPDQYQTISTARFKFKKPWFVPSGIFKALITSEIEKQIPPGQAKLFEEISNEI